jgi:hypothetical protein
MLNFIDLILANIKKETHSEDSNHNNNIMKKVGLTDTQLEALIELVNAEMFRSGDYADIVAFLQTILNALNSAIES